MNLAPPIQRFKEWIAEEKGSEMQEEKKDWVDFKKLKSEVGFAEVLESFNLLGGMELEGMELVGRCPFHESRDASKRSFYVNAAKGTFHCFACKKAGNVLDFVRIYQSVGVKEAGKYLEKILEEKTKVKESLEVENSTPATSPAAATGEDPERDPDPPGEQVSNEKLLSQILAVLERIEQKISWFPSK